MRSLISRRLRMVGGDSHFRLSMAEFSLRFFLCCLLPGILEGSVFPKINTPGKLLPPTQVEKAESNSAAAPQVGKPAEPSVTPTSTPTPMPTATPPTLQATDFLRGTGPTDGVSFALLIVWSFIAGFAERLVPDTLNRLVAKNEAIKALIVKAVLN